MLRVLVVAALLALVVVATVAYRRRERSLQTVVTSASVPAELLGDGERTWVVFSTPLCATCGPAEARLRTLDPDAHVVRVDATQRPELASALRISAAPTVLLADRDGAVQRRLAGPRAVMEHLDDLVAAGTSRSR
jgi:hypothetical protein